jgi:putative copper export protein
MLEGILSRFNPVSWFCLVVLVGSGLFQMSASPNYAGFLAFTNRWSVAILVKHLLFLLMVGVNAGLSWGVLPELKRQTYRRSKVPHETGESPIWRRNLRLLQLNFLLGVLILGLTALARIS